MARKSDIEKFNNMSKPERRVAVSKDVIKQINSGLFTASSHYFYPKYDGFRDISEEDLPKTPCRVCGIGAAAIAKTIKFSGHDFDNHPLDFNFDQEDCHGALSDCFTQRQLNVIEDWFEDAIEGGFPSWTEKSKENRMLCIYQSIIDNKGKVLPSAFNDYE